MKINTSNNSMMPSLFLVFVIFMLVLICLNCKNSSMACILTHFQLISKQISATVAGNDRSWLVFQNVKKRNKRPVLTSCVSGSPEPASWRAGGQKLQPVSECFVTCFIIICLLGSLEMIINMLVLSSKYICINYILY